MCSSDLGGSTNPMVVRADGTVDGRRVAVIRFPVSALPTGARVLLSTNVSTTSGTSPVQAHVYGMTDDTWTEGTTTFSSLTSTLEQNVPAGNVIANNVVAAQGTRTFVVGQLVASSTTAQQRLLDVTDFVRSQTDGAASFLVVQDHRWNVNLSDLTTGDTQPAGLRIASREAAGGPSLVVLASSVTPPSTSTTTTSTTTTLPTGTTIVAEAESLTIAASSGDSTGIKSDSQSSGGKSLLYRSNAVGDFVTLRLSVPAAGSYAVTITAKMMGDRCTFQFAVADSLAGDRKSTRLNSSHT